MSPGGRLSVHRGGARYGVGLHAGGGKVQRVALFQNKGVTFEQVPTVDDVAAHWSEIDDLSAAELAAFKL